MICADKLPQILTGVWHKRKNFSKEREIENMKIPKLREIVIEFERVQVIRKRARTHLLFCADCRGEADFVAIDEASSLFNTETETLFQFIKNNTSHYELASGGEIFVCLPSLLSRMKAKTDRYRLEGN